MADDPFSQTLNASQVKLVQAITNHGSGQNIKQMMDAVSASDTASEIHIRAIRAAFDHA
jgi:hypothetical protein